MFFNRADLFLTDADKAAEFWEQDDVHMPYPFTPLYASFQLPAMSEGTQKAFAAMSFPMTEFKAKLENGYFYQATIPYQGDPEARLNQHIKWSQERFPKIMSIYQNYIDTEFLPFYEKIDEFRKQSFTRAEAVEKIQELYAFYKRAWELHFEIVMPRGVLGTALEQVYGRLAPTKDSAVIYEWLVGNMNKSLETNRGLWQLAEAAKESAELRETFAKTPPDALASALDKTEAGRAFLEKVGVFLEEYGYRATHSHEFVDETWVENPAPALGVIARYLETGYDFEREFAEVVAKREQAFATVVASLPEGEGKQQFLALYQMALDCWGLEEDHHFYIDAMLPAKSRLFLLETGKLLVQAGAISSPQDVFYLYLDELVDLLQQPRPSFDLIEQRQREYAATKTIKPAPTYGQPPAGEMNPMLERVMGPQIAQVDETKIKGAAASQGIYTGTVRVVHSPSDFSNVQQGEVLVCKTTTPAWTALFSIVGAIITDAGGILSHAGTVAREYKLPAVLGTKAATSLLKDGQTVTVDGTQGLVFFHE
jgi:pyruvate,water dikinase